jgi:hypothetical protein
MYPYGGFEEIGFPASPLAFLTALIFAARVLGVEFIKDVDKRRHVIVLMAVAVHTVVDGDEADICIREDHLRVHSDFEVVPSKSAHILYNDGFLQLLHPQEPIRRFQSGRSKLVPENPSSTKKLCVGETHCRQRTSGASSSGSGLSWNRLACGHPATNGSRGL